MTAHLMKASVLFMRKMDMNIISTAIYSKYALFKVSISAFGKGYGELLLKTIFHYAAKNAFDFIFITVYPKHKGLIRLLEDFGFLKNDSTTELGEFIYIKQHSYNTNDLNRLSPYEFNVMYGPLAIKFDSADNYIVPILPKYHRILFPENETQECLFHDPNVSGNAIRKAYLCRSKTKQIQAGSILYFYRSEDIKSVCCIGVVDKTFRSKSTDKIARFVGTRTVYSYKDIESLCTTEVLAILFRHAKTLDNPITYNMLKNNHILKAPPQSIIHLNQERAEWLRPIVMK